jgi:ribosomal protein L6P/L9E
MMQNKRIRFEDILKIKKGDPLPDGTNYIPLEAVKKTNDDKLMADFKRVEENRWFGSLSYNGVVFNFRSGVCQNFTKKMQLFGSEFDMNVLNDNVDFRIEKKDKKNESSK